VSFDHASLTALRKWIADERSNSLELLGGGQILDFAAYRYSVGYIRALDDVIKVLEQIQTDLQKG
jgi:hypothetical protein